MFSDIEVTTIRIVYASSATLSLLGSLFIMITYSLNRRIQSFVLRIVFCLAISDLGYSLASLMVFSLPVNPGTPFSPAREVICKAQGAGIQYFQLSSFLWTSCIAWHACGGFVLRKTKEQLESYFKYYVIISWVVPLIPTAVLLFYLNAFGLTDSSWCWIVKEQSNYRFYLFWGPVMCIWVFDCVCYALVKRKLREVISFMEQSASRRILAYVLAFILVTSVPLTNRILQEFFLHNLCYSCSMPYLILSWAFAMQLYMGGTSRLGKQYFVVA